MDKSFILNEIKNKENIKTNRDFADFLGIKPTTLSMWYKRNTFDIELIFKKCEYLNPQWLLTGKGTMLKEEKESICKPNEDPTHVNEEASSYNRAKTSKNIVDEKHLLKEENKALVQDKIDLMQDKMALMQQNGTLKEENITLKYKVKELEAQNNSLTTENTLLKKAQKSAASIQDNEPELTTEK